MTLRAPEPENGAWHESGAQIGFRSARHPDDTDVTLGTRDHPEQHPAERHVWISDKLPWLHLGETLPAPDAHTPVEGG